MYQKSRAQLPLKQQQQQTTEKKATTTTSATITNLHQKPPPLARPRHQNNKLKKPRPVKVT